MLSNMMSELLNRFFGLAEKDPFPVLVDGSDHSAKKVKSQVSATQHQSALPTFELGMAVLESLVNRPLLE